jgi:hypothetical protein
MFIDVIRKISISFNGRMGSEWILGRLAWGGVDWIRLSQDRRAVVSAVMNLRVLAPRS